MCLQQVIRIYGVVFVHLSHGSLLSQISTFIQERNNLLLLHSNFGSLIRSLTILLSLLHANICTLNTHQHLSCFSSRISSRCGLLWRPWGAGGEVGMRHATTQGSRCFRNFLENSFLSWLEFIAFKHNLSWSEKLLHIPGSMWVGKAAASFYTS